MLLMMFVLCSGWHDTCDIVYMVSYFCLGGSERLLNLGSSIACGFFGTVLTDFACHLSALTKTRVLSLASFFFDLMILSSFFFNWESFTDENCRFSINYIPKYY